MIADLPIQIPKTIEGLREALFDEINLVRSGKGDLQRARAVAQLASQAIDSIRVQIQYGRMLLANQDEKPIQLGVETKDSERNGRRSKSV
jgi:hypothetical protein